ncbi:MAG: endo alpha-1,4 polygalactosaminidase [Rickettsiales bacterium]
MGKRLKQVLAALLCVTGCTPTPRPIGPVKHWAVYYNDIRPSKDFKHLDLVVFDRRHHPDIDDLKGNTIVLAYVSIGEVYDDVPERLALEKKNALLSQHDVWRSHAVDISSPAWRKLVLGYVADAADRGFDGVMLDTVDSPLYWAETQAPKRLDAMKEAAVLLIHDIRKAHPKMKIMLNRGFSILPLVSKDINYILAESIMTNTNVSTGQFGLFPTSTYEEVAEQLQRVVARIPQLQVLTLDYWDQEDVNGLERIYASQRASGFVPYVTTPDLTVFTPEPGFAHEYD